MADTLKKGDRLGPYEIEDFVAAGGMGEVYKARDVRLHRIVAVKRLFAPHSDRFQKEALAIAALNHPHICQVYDVGNDYLVLEYIDGSRSRGPLALESALRLATQVASALEAAHARQILHRDLKPGNILVTRDGDAKLVDFGIATHTTSDAEPTRTATGVMLGTAAYMSP